MLRNTFLGIALALTNVIIVVLISSLITTPEWLSRPFRFLIFPLISFLIFFIGGRYFGRKIFLATIIATLLLICVATVLMATMTFPLGIDLSKPVLPSFIERVPNILKELALASVAFWVGVFSNSKDQTK